MSDIFQEVDEEFKRDKVAQFFKKHANLLIGLALLVIAGVGGYRVYTYLEMKKAAEAGLKFESALALATEGKTDEAKAALEAMQKDAPAGYQALIRFKLASDLAKTDKAGAAKAFDALAGDAGLDQNLRDLAKLRAGLLLVDSAPYAEIEQRLNPLTPAAQPWRLAAREALAAAALKAHDSAKAQSYLEMILADTEASRAVRERAEMMMALVLSGAAAK